MFRWNRTLYLLLVHIPNSNQARPLRTSERWSGRTTCNSEDALRHIAVLDISLKNSGRRQMMECRGSRERALHSIREIWILGDSEFERLACPDKLSEI